MKELLDMYVKKYSDHSLMLVVKSLVYFDDAESQAITELLKKADWSEVKAEIGRSIVNYIKIATAG